MADPWYADGLNFTCTACGTCCSGEPGAVWVNDDEIAELAAHLGTTPTDIEATYVRRLGSRRALLERFDGDCIFLDATSRRCTVYAARPATCRSYPGEGRCGYYDFLKFERRTQNNPEFVAQTNNE